MKLRGISASVLGGLAATAVAFTTVAPAYGVAGPADPDALAAQAQEAADLADQAFIDAQWEDVLTHANAFDAAHGELEVLRAAAADAVAAAQDAVDAAQAGFDGAEGDRAAAQAAYDAAFAASAAADDAQDDARKARNKAVQKLRDAKAEVERLEALVPGAEQAVADAETRLANAETDLADAEADYQTPVAELLGAPAWWTSVVSEPVTVAQLFARIDEAQGAVEAMRTEGEAAVAALEAAQAAVDSASTLAQRIAARIAQGRAIAEHGGTALEFGVRQTRVTVLQRAADETGASSIHATLVSAQAEHAAATEALAQAQADDEQLGEDLDAARVAVEEAKANRDAKALALNDAKREANRLQTVEDDALAALNALGDERDAKALVLSDAQTALAEAQAALAKLDGLLAGLGDAQQSVADRRADLVDLEVIRGEVVWASLGAPDTAQPGDVVELTFQVPGSSLYDLSDASVAVVSPEGLAPECDIVDGMVAAGSVVTCTVDYEVTPADVIGGTVQIDVTLSGYLPLGPGNPRSAAVTRTLLEVNHSVSFNVEALASVVSLETTDEDVDAELAETGADTQLIAPAALLALVGAAFVIAARRERV